MPTTNSTGVMNTTYRCRLGPTLHDSITNKCRHISTSLRSCSQIEQHQHYIRHWHFWLYSLVPKSFGWGWMRLGLGRETFAYSCWARDSARMALRFLFSVMFCWRASCLSEQVSGEGGEVSYDVQAIVDSDVGFKRSLAAPSKVSTSMVLLAT